MARKTWGTGRRAGWKFRALKRGRSVGQIRKTQRRITGATNRRYRPYRPKIGRSYNRRLGGGRRAHYGGVRSPSGKGRI